MQSEHGRVCIAKVEQLDQVRCGFPSSILLFLVDVIANLHVVGQICLWHVTSTRFFYRNAAVSVHVAS